MMETIVFFMLVWVGLFGQAFFSGAETAFVSVNFLKLIHLIEKKNKRAMQAHDILKKPDRFLATTLIGTNLSEVLASSCAAALFVQVSLHYGALLTTLVMTPVSFIFFNLLPKTVCRYRANRFVLAVARPMMVSERVFLPFVNFFTFLASSIGRVVNPRGVKRNPFLTKDDIKTLIKDISREGILEPHEKEAIDKIFEMTLTQAADTMVPLGKVAALDVTDTFQAVQDKCRASNFTRFPVFDGKIPVGMVNIFDVFYQAEDKPWTAMIRPMVPVAHDESLDKIFAKMQPHQEVLAAVFKGPQMVGILTMEDLMEQITSRLTAPKK